jgi:hypothetical protein
MLADWLMRTSFGSRDLEIALTYRRMELTGGGYRRQRVPAGSWTLDGATATVVTRFGPFTAPVMFDSLVLFDGSERLQDMPGEGLVQLNVGASWEQEIYVAMAADG